MRALLLAVVAGCWTGSATPPTTPKDETAEPQPTAGLECAPVVAHAMAVSKDEIERVAKPDQIERIRIAATDSCLAQRWSQELLACFNAAASDDDLGNCHQTKMTKAQYDDMQERMIEAIQGDQNPCGGNPCGGP